MLVKNKLYFYKVGNSINNQLKSVYFGFYEQFYLKLRKKINYSKLKSINCNLKILHTILIIFSAISFLFYGYGCLFSNKMKEEFLRFKLSATQRKITGVLQIIAGFALLFSFISPLVGIIATAGLTIQMLLGFMVRLRIKDPIILSLPSFVFMIFNGYLLVYFLKIYL